MESAFCLSFGMLYCYRKGERKMETLYQKLRNIQNTTEYAFHMPGHKRVMEDDIFQQILKMDITEIEGFDNLHHPEGIIKKEQEFAAELYNTQSTFFLVNGSTCGVLSAICAVTRNKERFVMARNSHKSAYNAVYLKELQPIYVYPQTTREKSYIQGSISPEDVAMQMDKSQAKIVFLTSPTYEGVISDIHAIAQEVHKRNGILIVDEAHGAHLGFHPGFPKSAVTEGADIVVQSMHKTLPTMTQTALLHICSDRVSYREIARQLSIFQTSSPSYVFMASMSQCLHFLQEKGKEYFDNYKKRLTDFYNSVKQLKNLQVLVPEDAKSLFKSEIDPSKISIIVENCMDIQGCPYTGKDLAKDLLETYQLQMEMVSEFYVLAMTSICDTQEGFDRLVDALFKIDARLTRNDKSVEWRAGELLKAEAVMTLKAALEAEKTSLEWEQCVSEISGEYIYLYPPGSPIITPGEKITKEIYEKIERCKSLGLNVQGPEDYSLSHLKIVRK